MLSTFDSETRPIRQTPSGSFEPDNMPVIAFAPVRQTDAVVLSMAWETVNRDDGSSFPILSENDGNIYWLFLTRVNAGE